jgi:uncharacterized protein YwlG (UPF0340 family)
MIKVRQVKINILKDNKNYILKKLSNILKTSVIDYEIIKKSIDARDKDNIKYIYEFDCVVKRVGDKYDFYECKFFDRKMTAEECKQEKKQLEEIKGITVERVGFVSIEGFSSKKIKDFVLVDGNILYS